MISRRILRIKALMALYAFNRRDDDNLVKAEKELIFSIEKTYELYHLILLLIVEIADIAIGKIELALKKKMPDPDDLRPNRRFISNKVIDQIRNNKQLNEYLSGKKISWANNPEIPRKLYSSLLQWKPFYNYMTSSDSSYAADKKFLVRVAAEFLAASEDLVAGLEEQSIYWNDDLEYVLAMVEKTLKRWKPGDDNSPDLMPLYKNEDDEKYVIRLFRKSVLDVERCNDLIDRNTTNWEIERIALMDILVMKLAITELLEFPEIPVKVTLNEYIEIAKYYCTSKSSTFVNGILDKVVTEMRNNKMFVKTGRGLIGETGIPDEN